MIDLHILLVHFDSMQSTMWRVSHFVAKGHNMRLCKRIYAMRRSRWVRAHDYVEAPEAHNL